jgi:hypothetical protein
VSPASASGRARRTLRDLFAPVARTLLKHVVLNDPSLRSHHFGTEQVAMLAARFVEINDIRGSYLEFGLYRGASFAQFHHAFRRRKLHVPMFGFDSFEGMPQAHGPDADPGFRPYAAGHFSCTEAELRRELTRRRVPPERYTLIPGYYDRSLRPALYARPGLAAAAVVFLDCFYLESTRTALEFVTPIVQSGSLVMLNSYFRFKGHPAHGERGALEAWARDHPGFRLTEYARFGTAGIAFIVHPPTDA